MTLDEFSPEEDYLSEISHKLSSVSIVNVPSHGERIQKSDLATAKYLLYSSEPQKIRQSTEMFRRYLVQSIKKTNDDVDHNHTLVNDILDLDILGRLKYLLLNPFEPSLKFECTWILTNIAAGDSLQTQAVVRDGFVDVLLELVSDKRSGLELNSQAVWTLANIAGESAKFREELLIKGFGFAIVNLLETIYEEVYDVTSDAPIPSGPLYISDKIYDASIEILLWALSNMSRGGFRTAYYYDYYIPMFEVFTKYIELEVDKYDTDICWGVSRILYNMHEVDEFHERVQISLGMCRRLAHLIGHGTYRQVTPAIRAVVNITSGPDRSSVGLLHVPILQSMSELLLPGASCELRKDVYLIISNIAAGCEFMVDSVLTQKEVMVAVMGHLEVPGHIYVQDRWIPSQSALRKDTLDEWKVTREALWIVFNLATLGTDGALVHLIHEHPGLAYHLVTLLNFVYFTVDSCERILETLICFLKRVNELLGSQNPFLPLFYTHQTEQALTRIQTEHPQEFIKELCSTLLCLVDYTQHNVVLTDQMAHQFGLPSMVAMKSKSSKRRVIRGLEDGDVRLIENAVGNLCI
ncbi:armadillo-type protein [Sporodiniella umbellata]|nr:armadillo-type protein [Sporodiniella umbellata]